MEECKKIKVGFMGTPDFSCPVLERLFYDDDIELLFVVTKEDKPTGRGKEIRESDVKSLIKSLCEKNNKVYKCYQNDNSINIKENEKIICNNISNEEKKCDDKKYIKIFTPHKIKEDRFVIEEMTKMKPDFIIVVAYGQILSKEILDIPTFACINGHASLLPKYRGSSPIQQSILEGDEETGVSAMLMGEGLDDGDVLDVCKVKIEENDTGESLFEKLSVKTADLLVNTIKNFDKLERIKQDEEKATYVKMIKKEDGFINLENETFEQIDRKMRAYYPWPGAYIIENGKRIKIFSIKKVDISQEFNDFLKNSSDINKNADIYNQKSEENKNKQNDDNIKNVNEINGNSENTVDLIKKMSKNRIIRQIKDGFLEILELQQEGKKRMKAKDFLNGNRFNE